MLFAIVKRGQNAGIRVTPHKYRDGMYRVAVRKEGPYTSVRLEEIAAWVRRGFGVRMSNRGVHHPPGLFRPESIKGWE